VRQNQRLLRPADPEYQDGFEKQYVNYLQQNDKLYKTAVEDSNSSYARLSGC
jgi:hypothetical protein